MRRALRKVDDDVRAWVAQARRREISWERLGQALGMKRQSAWERLAG
jgi:biotin operon repressor